LFAIIGTNYGLGDSTTTFNLPDFRGRFQRGIDSGAGRDPGRVFNAATGSSQADDFFAHDHVSYVPADETYNDGLSLYNPLYTGSPGHAQWTTIGEDGDKKNTFLMVTSTISQIPAPANHPGTETRPKNVIVQYIIKT
jgi:microcystin-dependent protein